MKGSWTKNPNIKIKVDKYLVLFTCREDETIHFRQIPV